MKHNAQRLHRILHGVREGLPRTLSNPGTTSAAGCHVIDLFTDQSLLQRQYHPLQQHRLRGAARLERLQHAGRRRHGRARRRLHQAPRAWRGGRMRAAHCLREFARLIL